MSALRRPSRLVWIGIGAAPLAWATQHVVGVAFALAQCDPAGARWRLPVRGWDLGTAIAAAVVALAGIAAAVVAFLDTRELQDEPPPASRIRFMAILGMTTSPLFLAIIVLNGLGSGLVDICRQS
jgi:hypothetical protein